MARPLVNPRMAAALRPVSEGLMLDTCAIVRDSDVYDNEGGMTTTPLTVSTSPCNLYAVGSGAERAMADRMGWTAAYAVRLPLTVSVTPSDRLLISGRTFEIGGILANGATATAKIAVCQEVGS